MRQIGSDNMRTHVEVSGYDTMRFLRAGVGSSVVGTDLTLVDILATEHGVTLVYRTDNGRLHQQRLGAVRTDPDPLPRQDLRALLDYGWSSEERDYIDNPGDRHIFLIMRRLDDWLHDSATS
jgi:hypothetical protein